MNKSLLSKFKKLWRAMLEQIRADVWLFVGALIVVGPLLRLAFPDKADELTGALSVCLALLVMMRASLAGLQAGNETVDDIAELAALVEMQNNTALETYALARDIAGYLKMSDVDVAMNDFERAKLSAMRSEAPNEPAPPVYERPTPTQRDLEQAQAMAQKLTHGTMKDIRVRLFTLVVENMKLTTEINQHRLARGLPPITEFEPHA